MSHNTSKLARDQTRVERHDHQEVQPESCLATRLHIHELGRIRFCQTLTEPPMTMTQIILHALTSVQRFEVASYAPR